MLRREGRGERGGERLMIRVKKSFDTHFYYNSVNDQVGHKLNPAHQRLRREQGHQTDILPRIGQTVSIN